ncbi:hypothetical protein XENORESO_006200 [Xenotaenia resolanae]|uniref:Uncharacterized protein n=1 Tax=Xenotaenia resolanae TaxID=208358 RepID=A0ABV0X763_9TELE
MVNRKMSDGAMSSLGPVDKEAVLGLAARREVPSCADPTGFLALLKPFAGAAGPQQERQGCHDCQLHQLRPSLCN